MLTAENNRLPTASKPVAKRIAAHIRWLEKELSRTDRDLEEAINSSPTLGENEALLRSVPMFLLVDKGSGRGERCR